MAIEVLKKDAHCSECGFLLRKGTQAKVYRKADGTVLVYGFNCHARPVKTVSGETVRQPQNLNGEEPAVSTEATLSEITLEKMLFELCAIRQLLELIYKVLSEAKERIAQEKKERKGELLNG